MTALWTQLQRLCLAAVMLTMSTLAAVASCPTSNAEIDAMIAKLPPVQTAQRALRTALGFGLDVDNRIGPLTRTAVVNLCDVVPHTEGRNASTATVEVMREYLALSNALPPAAQLQRVFDRNMTAEAAVEGPKTIGLALASTVPFKSRVVLRQPPAFDCTGIVRVLSEDPNASRAMNTLTRVFDDLTETQICARISAPASAQVVREGYARLGRLNTLRPGALATLASPAFLAWIDDDRIARLRRLMATESAIAVLLDDFAADTEIPGATPYTGSDCTPPVAERTGRFFQLTDDDIANIKTLVSLTPVLEGFAADNPRFDSAGAMWRDLEPVIESTLGDCIVPDVESLVLGPETLPKSFQLSTGAAETLSGLDPLKPAAAVLADFAPRSFPTKAEYMSALRAALTAAATDEINATVEKAADTMAAAAEPMVPLFDTANVEIPEEDLLPAQTAPQLGVTEAADEAVSTVIDNPELASELAGAAIAPSPVPEQLKAQVRTVLAPEAQRQVDATVEEQIALIEPSVVAGFGLTGPLAQAINALPYVHAAMVDSTGMNLLARLEALKGVEYPTQRLFREALQTISDEDPTRPLSPFVIERIIQAATKEPPAFEELRSLKQLAIDDCKCVPTLRRDDLHVYGFFPFWLGQRDPEVIPEGEDPDPLRQVDFGTVTDLAFYGLEFTYDQEADRLSLNNTTQWLNMRRTFINSAHSFRAQADLAFDMRDWTRWSDSAIERAVTLIVREVQPLERVPAYSPGQLAAAIPTLFDPVRPDGVTLIFPGYLGTGLSKTDMEQMITIIKRVFETLPRRNEVKINVAFDFQVVVEPLNQPLFDELFQLLVEQPYVLQGTTVEEVDAAAKAEEEGKATPIPSAPPELERVDAKVIDKVLLFLERPTSDAKKGLRFRMEQGFFQGREREAVLRRLIPVLPPSGHRDILQSVKPNSPRTDTPLPFSQLVDDIVYFEDNFSGVGFWPVPDTLSSEGPKIAEIIAEEFGPIPWNKPFSGVQSLMRSTCGTICPNRSVIMLASIAGFVVMLFFARQSFYAEWAYKIGYRLFFRLFGTVAAINTALLASLGALWVCDPASTAPSVLFLLLAGTLSIVGLYNFYQRVKNGPTP